MSDFNDSVIAEFRANGGHVRESANFGNQLVLLHTRGARSGTPRINPVIGIRDRRGWLIAASAAGAPKDPAWAHNLRAHPDIEIEYSDADTVATTMVQARELDGDEYEEAWRRFTHRSPMFERYRERAGDSRRIPLFALTPPDGST